MDELAQKSLGELAQVHKKGLEDDLSLRRTVGELGQELAKLLDDNKKISMDSPKDGGEGKSQ